MPYHLFQLGIQDQRIFFLDSAFSDRHYLAIVTSVAGRLVMSTVEEIKSGIIYSPLEFRSAPLTQIIFFHGSLAHRDAQWTISRVQAISIYPVS